jgi:hypothetical protein
MVPLVKSKLYGLYVSIIFIIGWQYANNYFKNMYNAIFFKLFISYSSSFKCPWIPMLSLPEFQHSLGSLSRLGVDRVTVGGLGLDRPSRVSHSSCYTWSCWCTSWEPLWQCRKTFFQFSLTLWLNKLACFPVARLFKAGVTPEILVCSIVRLQMLHYPK